MNSLISQSINTIGAVPSFGRWSHQKVASEPLDRNRQITGASWWLEGGWWLILLMWDIIPIGTWQSYRNWCSTIWQWRRLLGTSWTHCKHSLTLWPRTTRSRRSLMPVSRRWSHRDNLGKSERAKVDMVTGLVVGWNYLVTCVSRPTSLGHCRHDGLGDKPIWNSTYFWISFLVDNIIKWHAAAILCKKDKIIKLFSFL